MNIVSLPYELVDFVFNSLDLPSLCQLRQASRLMRDTVDCHVPDFQFIVKMIGKVDKRIIASHLYQIYGLEHKHTNYETEELDDLDKRLKSLPGTFYGYLSSLLMESKKKTVSHIHFEVSDWETVTPLIMFRYFPLWMSIGSEILDENPPFNDWKGFYEIATNPLTNLVVLDISFIEFDEVKAQQVLKAFTSENCKLKELTFMHTNGLVDLTLNICKVLSHVNCKLERIRGTYFDSECFIELSKAIQLKHSKLRSLFMEYSEFMGSSVEVFCRALGTNSCMKELDIDHCEIDYIGTRALIDVISSGVCSLTHLTLLVDVLDNHLAVLLRKVCTSNGIKLAPRSLGKID